MFAKPHLFLSILLPGLLALGLSGCNLSRQNRADLQQSDLQQSDLQQSDLQQSESTSVAKISPSPGVAQPSHSSTDCSLKPSVKTDDFPLPDSLPSPPASISWNPIAYPRASESSFNLGIGYLGPVPPSSPDTPEHLKVSFQEREPNWLKPVILPLYHRPNGQIQGWIACGWLVTRNPNRVVPFKPALFYPGYSGFGFIVLDAQENQWLKLRYADSGEVGNGVAWVKVSHVLSVKTPLGFVRWRDRYRSMMKAQERYAESPSKDWGYLFFRNREATHALRALPSEQSERIAWIGPNHSLFPLEIRENWMRVRVYQPNNFCDTEWQGTVQEGWVRWMDRQSGNWLSEPYKGC